MSSDVTAASSVTFAAPQVRHLFSTPLVIAELPPALAADINPRLRDMILARANVTQTSQASNRGGWQSDDRLPDWGGADVQAVLGAISALVGQITMRADASGLHKNDVMWKVNGWANINRKGHSNVQHIHPGAYWSAVYYVDVDDEASGGSFQAFDPRGGLATMYCPVLRIGIDGYLNSGSSVAHMPKAGQCLLFPSWMPHAVTPYMGEGARISLAFNFSI
jgi:uncharacterized protein (TIGR02466 family)